MSQATATMQKKRRRGRPKLKDASVSFKVPWADLNVLRAVSLYEGREQGEILRSQFLKVKKEYRKDPAFRRFVAKHAEELLAQGIQPEEIF